MAAMGDAVIQQLLSGCFTSHSFMLVEKTHMTSGLMFARRQFRNTGKEIGRKCCGMIRQTPLALPIAPAGPILLLYQWSLYIVQYTGNGCMILCMWYCFSILAVLKYLVKQYFDILCACRWDCAHYSRLDEALHCLPFFFLFSFLITIEQETTYLRVRF